jgi:ATP-dependent Lhr-like helicase
VVLVRGHPVLYVERGGRRLRLFGATSATRDDGASSGDGAAPALDAELLAAAVAALRDTGRGRRRPLRVERINGIPALKSDHLGELRRAGFRMEPNALVLDVEDGRGAGSS